MINKYYDGFLQKSYRPAFFWVGLSMVNNATKAMYGLIAAIIITRCMLLFDDTDKLHVDVDYHK
jgi:hypothetical protein